MIAVSLDPQGRLIAFDAVPPQQDTEPRAAQPYDWSELFNLAGLDMTQFHSAAAPLEFAGRLRRSAPPGPEYGRVPRSRCGWKLASWHGKPVFFQLISDWTKPDRMPSTDSSQSRAPEILLVLFLLLMLAGAVWLALPQLCQPEERSLGRFRLGPLIFVLQMLVWLFSGHFVPSLDSFGLFVLAASTSVFLGALSAWFTWRWSRMYAAIGPTPLSPGAG